MTSNTVDQLLTKLESDAEREQVAVELQGESLENQTVGYKPNGTIALRSIYSEEDGITIWMPEKGMPMCSASQKIIRLELRTA